MKLRAILKSKIHRAIVTGADIDYVGSVGVDRICSSAPTSSRASGCHLEHQQRHPHRHLCDQPAARLRPDRDQRRRGCRFHPGDKVIIVAFCLTDEAVEPRMIAVDEQNRFVRDLVPNGSPEDIPEPCTSASEQRTGNDEDTSHRSDCRRRHRQGSDPAAISVLNMAAEQSNFRCEFTELPWGCDYYLQTGRMMDADGIAQLLKFDAIYLGAIGDPRVADHISARSILPLRQRLGQYVNLRRRCVCSRHHVPAGEPSHRRHRHDLRARELRGRCTGSGTAARRHARRTRRADGNLHAPWHRTNRPLPFTIAERRPQRMLASAEVQCAAARDGAVG